VVIFCFVFYFIVI